MRNKIVPISLCCTAIAVLSYLTLFLGELGLDWAAVRQLGVGQIDPTTQLVLTRLRGPRLLTAILAGALFGISGLLFQHATRNPLGSPDVIGINAGAKAGMALCATFPFIPDSLAAAAGAFTATLLVFIATGKGFTSATRTIIAGIAVGALAHGITQYVLTAKLRLGAHQVAAALSGSLNASSWRDVTIAASALIVVIAAAVLVSKNLLLLELGDDVAGGLGGAPTATRTWAVVISAIAAAAAVSAAGPISFVALSAPHIARLWGKGLPLMLSAAIGSIITMAADLTVQQVNVVKGLPTGIITLGVGGLYLAYVLFSQQRKMKL